MSKQILNDNNNNNIRSDLARLYRISSRIQNAQSKTAKCMKNVICNLGKSYIEKSKQSIELIKLLINLHNTFLTVVKIQFHSEQIFHKALKEAFEEFINTQYYPSAQLTRFVNKLLTKTHTMKSSKFIDVETTMNQIVMLYGYIGDKYIFERDYQMFLANRLLCDLGGSEQSERSMIGKLKAESGIIGHQN